MASAFAYLPSIHWLHQALDCDCDCDCDWTVTDRSVSRGRILPSRGGAVNTDWQYPVCLRQANLKTEDQLLSKKQFHV